MKKSRLYHLLIFLVMTNFFLICPSEMWVRLIHPRVLYVIKFCKPYCWLSNNIKIYNKLIFNFTDTTRPIYICIFYSVDNCIAGNEESSDLFSFSAFDSTLLELIRASGFSEFTGSLANQYERICLLCYVVKMKLEKGNFFGVEHRVWFNASHPFWP